MPITVGNQITVDTTNNETIDRNLHHIQTNFNSIWTALGLGTQVANSGTVTMNSGTSVAVSDTGVTSSSIIIYTLKTAGGTVASPFTATITPGTGFHANSGGSDTSVYNWIRIG